MGQITITRDTGNSTLYTMEPQGTTVQKSWSLSSAPLVDNVIGEKKILEMKFTIEEADYLGDTINNKTICFTPGLFIEPWAIIPRGGYKFQNRFEFTVLDYTDTTEYDMGLVVQSGYLSDIAKNWTCTFEAIDQTSFWIRLTFYQMQDDRDWMSPVGQFNHNKLLRSAKNDPSDLPTSPNAGSVYKVTTQKLAYYLFIEDIDFPDSTKGWKQEKIAYQAGWYGFEEQEGAPFFTLPVFSLERDASPVTGLSPAFDTKVKFQVTTSNPAYTLTEAYVWMIRTDSNDDTVDFQTNYEASFAKITTDAGTDQIHNKIYEPSTGPTNPSGNDWYVDFMVKASELAYGETYRFIGIAYMKDGDVYEVNSFISDEYSVNDLPQFDGDGIDFAGTLKDYNKAFTGNELICCVEERLRSELQMNFPADQYKNDILDRLGLTIDNDIRTYMTKIVLEIYEEETVGSNVVKHIFDRREFLKTSPTTYTSHSGSTLTFGTDEATFQHDFRVRFESDIDNLETQIDGVVQTSPSSNQDWAGRTIKIEWKLVFYYDDYTTPFEESIRYIQKIKPHGYDDGTILDLEDSTKVPVAFYCNTDEPCMIATLSVSGMEGEEDEYRLITTSRKETQTSAQLEENEEWVGAELTQLDSPKFINQESEFSETVVDKANFCLDPSEFSLNTPYRITAIAKRVDYVFESENASNFWDALIAEEFDFSIYSVLEPEYKRALDDLFVDGFDDIFNKINYGLIFRGDTHAQKLLDIKLNVTPSIVNPPTIDIKYYDFDGADDHIDIGTDIATLNAVDETDGFFIDQDLDANSSYWFGAQSGGAYNLAGISAANNLQYIANNLLNYADDVVGNLKNNFYGIANGTDGINQYENGVLLGGGPFGGALPTGQNEFIGCYNNGGTAANFVNGRIACLIRTHGTVTVAQMEAMRLAWIAFKTATNSTW